MSKNFSKKLRHGLTLLSHPINNPSPPNPIPPQPTYEEAIETLSDDDDGVVWRDLLELAGVAAEVAGRAAGPFGGPVEAAAKAVSSFLRTVEHGRRAPSEFVHLASDSECIVEVLEQVKVDTYNQMTPQLDRCIKAVERFYKTCTRLAMKVRTQGWAVRALHAGAHDYTNDLQRLKERSFVLQTRVQVALLAQIIHKQAHPAEVYQD